MNIDFIGDIKWLPNTKGCDKKDRSAVEALDYGSALTFSDSWATCALE